MNIQTEEERRFVQNLVRDLRKEKILQESSSTKFDSAFIKLILAINANEDETEDLQTLAFALGEILSCDKKSNLWRAKIMYAISTFGYDCASSLARAANTFFGTDFRPGWIRRNIRFIEIREKYPKVRGVKDVDRLTRVAAIRPRRLAKSILKRGYIKPEEIPGEVIKNEVSIARSSVKELRLALKLIKEGKAPDPNPLVKKLTSICKSLHEAYSLVENSNEFSHLAGPCIDMATAIEGELKKYENFGKYHPDFTLT